MTNHRPRLVQISSVPVLPPFTGGAIRSYNLGLGLSRRCDVTLLCTAPLPRSTPASVPFLREMRRSMQVRFLPFPPETAAMDKPLQQAYAPLSSWMESLVSAIESVRAEAVILEHVWNVETLATLRERFPSLCCVLDAHNVESLNLSRYAALHPGRRSEIEGAAARALALESSLGRFVDQVWACSEHDAEALRAMNGGRLDAVVVPNGVDTGRLRFTEPPAARPVVAFTGTLHYPLVHESLVAFLGGAWPKVRAARPDARLIIAGRDPLPELTLLCARHPDVEVVPNPGDVAEVLGRAMVAVSPMLSGSGTRIKILEALAAGVPVVSTSIGAEGLEVAHERDVLLADGNEPIAAAIVRLLGDGELRERLRVSGRSLAVERYDWSVAVEAAFSALRRLVP